MGTIFLIIGRAKRDPPPPNHLGLDFHIYYVYIHTYVRTFLIRVRVLVICDRNSIARKQEEFLILVAEVASSCLHFASRARLLQLLQQTILHYASSQCGTQYNYY